ncbi:MAG: endonuclease III domain-containing protein [Oscillospiraceae bacterium]|nr:endonuclease III domain-containing protein [Oscillospiraceae bacterium]
MGNNYNKLFKLTTDKKIRKGVLAKGENVNAGVLMKIYGMLHAHYGDLNWWPAKTPYEVMVGAVLTQNTAWSNVERAIVNFDGRLSPEFISKASCEELTEIIRPAGFFNQKAVYLKAATEWYAGYDFDISSVKKEPLEKLRAGLLAVKGIGRETADSILLYAFGLPSFVVDAYTVRLCERYPLDAGRGYEEVKAYFESSVPKDTKFYNNYHALIVINGKEYCRRKPVCIGCPLYQVCAGRADG